MVGQGVDGLQAIDMVEELQPALVILDQRMPRLEGREAAEQIRRSSPNVIIVSFSGVLSAKPDWADEYLSKYDINELTPFLGRLLDEKRDHGRLRS